MDDDAKRNMFKQIHDFWVYPEFTRRREAGLLLDDFRIERCLVLLPKGKTPTVLFNDEIHWRAEVEIDQSFFQQGDSQNTDVHLHHIKSVKTVSLPEVDGRRVAFVYLYHQNAGDYGLVFDFTPNWEPKEPSEEVAPEDDLSKFLAKHLEARVAERVLCLPLADNDHLAKIGLWAVPSLTPHPLSVIIHQLEQGSSTAAMARLRRHCDQAWLEERVAAWDSLLELQSRRRLIAHALAAHARGEYALSIYSLMPQIEGIVTEWLLRNLAANDKIAFRQESKTKQLKDLLMARSADDHLKRHFAESAIHFVLHTALGVFKNWDDPINPMFANRNVIGHGRYDENLLTQDNSIKVFLLIDTLFHILR
jgi:hypothetical protein